MYTLSIVLLIPDAHKQAINDLTEASGYGPDNLSRPLVDADGNQWWGGHTMAAPIFLEDFASVTEYPEAMSALVMSVKDTTEPDCPSPLEHWNSTLEANGLLMVELE